MRGDLELSKDEHIEQAQWRLSLLRNCSAAWGSFGVDWDDQTVREINQLEGILGALGYNNEGITQ